MKGLSPPNSRDPQDHVAERSAQTTSVSLKVSSCTWVGGGPMGRPGLDTGGHPCLSSGTNEERTCLGLDLPSYKIGGVTSGSPKLVEGWEPLQVAGSIP